MSGPAPPPRRRNYTSTVGSKIAASGTAMNAVKLKQQMMNISAPPKLQDESSGPRSPTPPQKLSAYSRSLLEQQKAATPSPPKKVLSAMESERSERELALAEYERRSQSRFLYENDQSSVDYEYLLDEVPETSVGKGVELKGELQFDRLLRIEGSFEGKLSSGGSVVIGRQGNLVGDVIDMDALIIDGGSVIGNIQVQRLVVRGTAYLKGNCTAKSMKIGPHCTVIGTANIHSLAPEYVDSNGDVVIAVEPVDTSPLGDYNEELGGEVDDIELNDLTFEKDDEDGSEGEGGDDENEDGEVVLDEDGNPIEKAKRKSKKSKKSRKGKKHKDEGKEGEEEEDGEGQATEGEEEEGEGEENASEEGEGGEEKGDDEAGDEEEEQ